jgi:hypothetical protein
MSCLSSNPCPACLLIHVLPVFSHHQVVASMWAPWPGYAVPSSKWHLLLESDGLEKGGGVDGTVAGGLSQPGDKPVIYMRS